MRSHSRRAPGRRRSRADFSQVSGAFKCRGRSDPRSSSPEPCLYSRVDSVLADAPARRRFGRHRRRLFLFVVLAFISGDCLRQCHKRARACFSHGADAHAHPLRDRAYHPPACMKRCRTCAAHASSVSHSFHTCRRPNLIRVLMMSCSARALELSLVYISRFIARAFARGADRTTRTPPADVLSSALAVLLLLRKRPG